MSDMDKAISILDDLQGDVDISKSVKVRIISIKNDLTSSSKDELSLVINKALSDIEELSFDVNLQPFIRDQLLYLTCVLEDLA
ncbi:MAG: UPF0147 family protein [Candidatus Woesearchaeota archaeon]